MNPVTRFGGMPPISKFLIAFGVLEIVFITLAANGIEVSVPTGPFGAAGLLALLIYVRALDNRECDG